MATIPRSQSITLRAARDKNKQQLLKNRTENYNTTKIIEYYTKSSKIKENYIRVDTDFILNDNYFFCNKNTGFASPTKINKI